MKNWALVLIAFCMSGCQNNDLQTEMSGADINIEGINFIEQVNDQNGTLVIPYSKYELDNGLTVILHEDTSDPLVHVDITYHVGSGREDPGKSGFAHFFEHYKDLEVGKWVKIIGWEGPEAAKKEILDGIANYQKENA